MGTDAAGVAAVHVRSWQVGYRGLLPDDLLDGLSVEQRTRTRRERLTAGGPDSFTLVADEDEGVLGFCTAHSFYDRLGFTPDGATRAR